ncbi:MAG: class II fructose-bisphosphate aldolase [Mediterranea sp.]|jgi:ketose-bisphosphate aldolase|nr:class II fructose-bisphosphate aldolase [Mediterranea sp.]
MGIKSFKAVLNNFNSRQALLAFNVQNIYHLAALCELSNQENIPIIAQFSVRYIKLFDVVYGLENIVNRYKKGQVFFHLDHCKEFDVLEKCVKANFDGIMYDGSDLDLKENIYNTLMAKRLTENSNCLLEGEVGRIGGEEDGIVGNVNLVNVDDALLYYNETNVDILALGIGNAHGVYKDTSVVDVSILKKFNDRIGKKLPLVLHGTSGLNDKIVHEAITYGVRKINFSTDLKVASISFNQSYFIGKTVFDETSYFKEYTLYLKEFYHNHIKKYSILCI